jgi:integrative and conjugative element protein (TIGR02256 family)
MSRITLTSHAHHQLLTQIQLAQDGNETGGIVLGCDLGMGTGFIARHCGDPGPNAVRQPANFQRDLEHARVLAEQAAGLDGSVWIGEWHTHLLDLPIPSMHDLMTYRTLLLDREIGFPRLLSLIILSAEDGTWFAPRIFAWSISATSMRQLLVEVAESSELPEGERAGYPPRAS